MTYRLNLGIVLKDHDAKVQPESPVLIMVLTDYLSNLSGGDRFCPVIEMTPAINTDRNIDGPISTQSKEIEKWWNPAYTSMHQDDIERYQEKLHYLDFTGYCFKEKATKHLIFPTLIIVSNDAVIDRNLWESVSLNYVKSMVVTKPFVL